MCSVNFNAKASTYEQNALVQKAAGDVLLNLLGLQSNEDVLDLGCGPGNLTAKIAGLTQGLVTGVDFSEEMIKKAGALHKELRNVRFLVKDAADLGLTNAVDVIFCNSAFQWFPNPKTVLMQCLAALKPGGRMGIQAPATENYCPNFVAALEKVKTDPVTREIFSHFQSPWFFLNTTEEYAQFFAECGFQVRHCGLSAECTRYSPEQIYRVFQSGAENGYLNQAYYPVALSDDYIRTFRRLVKEALQEQADSTGTVELKFTRIYLVASKA